MSEKDLEGTQEPPEEEVPTSPPSVPSVDKPPSPLDDLDVETLAEKLAPHLAESLRPEWQKDDQSVKDRRIAGLTDDVQRLKGYIKQEGGDVDKAIREMQVDDMLAGRSEPTVRGGTGEGSSGLQAAMQAVSTEILSGAEIDFDDPEYIALTKQYAGRIQNAEDWRAVAQAFADRRTTKAAKQEGVTEAATVGATGKVAATGDKDYDALAAELAELQSQGASPENMIRRREILKEMGTEMSDGKRGIF